MSLRLSQPLNILRTSLNVTNRQLGSSIRFQSSFTFLNNHNLLLKRQLKQAKRKAKRLSTTITTTSKYHQHTQFSNISLNSNQNKPIPQLNKKYKFYSLPRVPSTKHIDREEINLSALYSGYRPMFINPRHYDASNANNTSTLYEFSMKFEEPNSIWYNSATGLETFDEWENIPASVSRNLKPFVPPPQNMKPSTVVSLQKNQSTEKDVLDMNLSANPEAFLEKMSGLIKEKRGRRKPVFTLLHSKKHTKN